MAQLTVVNQTTRPIVLGRASIGPRLSVTYDTARFATDPMDGGTLLTLFLSGNVKVTYQGQSLTETKLRQFLILPGPNGSAIAGSECPPTEPVSFDVTQYTVMVPNLTNAGPVTLYRGMVVRISDDLRIISAQADTLTNLRPALGLLVDVSLFPGNVGKAQLSGGFQGARFVGSLSLQAGDLVYVSASQPGLLTNVPELAPGNVIQEVGTVLDASEYVPSDPAPFARVMVRVQSPIVYYP